MKKIVNKMKAIAEDGRYIVPALLIFWMKTPI